MKAISYHRYKKCQFCGAIITREDEDFCRKCGKYQEQKKIKTILRWTQQQE